ncbi:MAG: GNAT family N-acetyltransferase [Verrucomicrobiae bacterium]|nr:GNAT family N-acetyltransferase [Verrucomicrobiae bacterium]
MSCRPLAPHEFTRAAGHMAASFHEDPGIRHILPDPSRREGPLTWMMGSFLRMGARYGHVLAAGDDPLGVAVFFHSTNAVPSIPRLLRGGWGLAPLRLGLPALVRVASCIPCLERQRTRRMPVDHVYLLSLSVAPAAHGRGLGGALLRAVLDHAVCQGLPCYLETFNHANLSFYRRHGFELLGEAHVPGRATIPFWCFAHPFPGNPAQPFR